MEPCNEAVPLSWEHFALDLQPCMMKQGKGTMVSVLPEGYTELVVSQEVCVSL